jgi:hypothetical protein
LIWSRLVKGGDVIWVDGGRPWLRYLPRVDDEADDEND